jgi:septal ring factor EnvC (AmiA/AmiB activator)
VGAGPKDELQELRERLEALKKEMEQAEEFRSEVADALKESERAISTANRKLKELKDQQREIDRTLAGLQEDSRQVQSRIQSQQEAVGKILHQQYLAGEQEYLRLLLNGQDPNRVARELYYLSYISRARADLVRKLRADLESLEHLRQASQEKSAELAAVLAQEATAKQQLEQEKQARKVVLDQIAKQIRNQRREIGKLKRDETRLARLVEKLGKMLSSRKPSAPGPRNILTPDASFDGRPFAKLKGQLRLPVAGELANRFGSPREAGLTWKGLFIRSPSGQDVKAVAGGRVVFADWLRGFGNLLILDHGQGFMSLYGFNESLLKQVGDLVRGGDAVAQVGNTGGNTDSGLYFEIRHEGKPVDPMGWVTLR